jgi:hypothetical protein
MTGLNPGYPFDIDFLNDGGFCRAKDTAINLGAFGN